MSNRNEKVHGAFELVRSERIASLNLKIYEYRHKVTGAQHFHLDTDNSENVFLVAFRTMPMDSTGVAHILEHTVLCGSERYPVRDPFFMMIRRSLNTFMNAFTSSDWTAYPFASQNRKDFFNLMDVYLDAAFFARLHPLDFAQEGHRFEFEEADNQNSDLVYKGVVFNEMKGAMSSAVSTLWQTMTKYLFPTTTYHYNSGGDPECIPDLSYEQLQGFYKEHYHPSNAVFMTFGDIEAYEHQEKFETNVLSKFEKLPKRFQVDDEKRYAAPVRVQEHYACDEEELSQKTHVVLAWLLGRSIDLETTMKAHLLSGVLLNDSASPLRRALETTELAKSPSPLCGLEDSNKQISFMCGVEGSEAQHAEEVEKLVVGVLEQVADEGVPIERVEAVLHQLELSQREIGGDGHPFGLQLILECMGAAVHYGDPIAVLDLDPVLVKLREEIKNPDFIKNLVKELLLDNAHRVTLTMVPDAEVSARRKEAEKQRLAEHKATLSDEASAAIVKLAHDLKQRQESEDDPEILPKVGIEDIPKEIRIPSGDQRDELNLNYYAQGTNGLVYQQLIVELPELNQECVNVLPYLTTCLGELGSGDRDYLETQMLQSSYTGGISAASHVRGAVGDVNALGGHFILSGKALTRNHEKLTELLAETLRQPRFDEWSRIKELINQKRAYAVQRVTGNGHALAMLAASSGISAGQSLSHQLSGLEGIKTLKAWDDRLQDESQCQALAQLFEQIHQQVRAQPLQFLLVADQEHETDLIGHIESQWPQAQRQQGQPSAFKHAFASRKVQDAWLTNTQVNFCAKAYATVPPSHEDAAALTVLGGFLRNGYLHRAIREQGGAYGGGASHDTDSACFRFYSYRDPRLEETLADFDRSIEWLLNEKHEWRLVEEAILGVISHIDKPGSPAGEAKKAFHNGLYGRTPEFRKHFRQRVLDVTVDDLKRVGELYLQPQHAHTAVIAPQSVQDEVEALELTPVIL